MKSRQWSNGWERKSQHCFCDKKTSKMSHESNVLFASRRRFPTPASATPTEQPAAADACSDALVIGDSMTFALSKHGLKQRIYCRKPPQPKCTSRRSSAVVISLMTSTTPLWTTIKQTNELVRRAHRHLNYLRCLWAC